MANLLQNPTLSGFRHGRYFHERDGKVGTIEHPDNWEFVAIPKESDPEKLPQSLHRDTGFVIGAAWRAWEAGYVQRNIQLDANTRYRARARLKADVNFQGGQPPDFTAITWRFRVVADPQILEQDWTMTTQPQLKQIEEHEWVFQTTTATQVDFFFMGRSFYAGNDCDFWVYELSLEAIPIEAGADPVATLRTPKSQTQPSPQRRVITQPVTTTPKPQPDAPTPASPTAPTLANLTELTGEDGKTLADVLSNDEIDQISAGLRALAAQAGKGNKTAISGLNTLAEALERLKVTSVG